MHLGKSAPPERIVIPARRHPKTGRFLPQGLAYRRQHGLGWWQALATAAAQYYTQDQAANNGGAMPSGGSGIAPGGPSTVVSPNIQTEISPQISPVFQQTQSSPGAVQAATATQFSPGGQSGRGGDASSFPLPAATAPYLPALPSAPSNYDQYVTRDYRPTDAGALVRDIRESAPFNWTPILWIAGIGAVSLLVVNATKRRRAA